MNLGKLTENAFKRYRTTPNMVADVLREAILSGILGDGQQLRQDEIAEQFGVSRIPVREALRKLEAEGLVTFYPHRGAVVSQLSPGEVREIFEIRVLLECQALHLAIPHLSKSRLKQAEAILEATDEEDDASRLSEFNLEFHTILYTPANRPYLLSFINNLHANVDRYMRICLHLIKHKAKSQQEHHQILEACRQRDACTAVEILKRHIETGGKLVIEYLQQERKIKSEAGKNNRAGKERG
ncbi:MAG: GntR family transcriptional regulator [Bacillota bacterium]